MLKRAKVLFLITVVSVILVIASIILSLNLFRLTKQVTADNETLRSSRFMVWVMDDSCSEQIKNNSDGILRLQL